MRETRNKNSAFMIFKSEILALLMLAAVTSESCTSAQGKMKQQFVPDDRMTQEEIAAGVFTPQVMWKMGRVGGSAVSPDGGSVVYAVTRYNMAENTGSSSLWLLPTAGGEAVRLTDEAGSDSDPRWNRSGDRIYFLSDRSGAGQVWSMAPDGSDLKQVTDIPEGIDAFGIAPSENRMFYTQKVKVEDRLSSEIYPGMDKSKARIYDDLMARHWNYWDEGLYSHIFVAEMDGGTVAGGTDIMEGEPWDAPTAPYFDAAEIAWNNAGDRLAYTCKKLTGTEYAVSTDSDIFLYDVAAGTTENICKGGNAVSDTRPDAVMPGYDKYPVFSPDDRYIAFRSMRRAGNESDKERLFLWDAASGSMRDLTEGFDYNASNVIWDGPQRILFIAPIEGTHQICEVNTAGEPQVRVLTEGDHDITAFTMGNGTPVAELTKMSRAAELYRMDDWKPVEISFVNRHIYDNVKMGEVVKRWVKTTDGKQMLTWVILPPDFDPAKKYPTLLYCEGGPQSVVSQAWSYRWNMELMASQGYIVVAPNRRGVPSFGQEWLDQISGDYSGQNIRDLLSAIDDVAAEPWVDNDRLGCVGASYGGYSAFFLAGNHDGRFKAFIAHCGIFDFDSMYGETEELWFVNNDYGGPYWDKKNRTAQRSYANSPHRFADRWDTPILIVTGEYDFRIPYTQSLEAFTAARVRGVPARLVVFENEAHQVFKPQNSIVWNNEFFGWLDKYVKQAK